MQINPNFWNCTKIDMCKGVKLKLPHAMQNEIFEQMLQKYFSIPHNYQRNHPFPHTISVFFSPKKKLNTLCGKISDGKNGVYLVSDTGFNRMNKHC